MILYAAVMAVYTEISGGLTRNVIGRMPLKRRAQLLEEVAGDVMGRFALRAAGHPGEEKRYLLIAPEYYFSAGSDRHVVSYSEKTKTLARLRAISLAHPQLILLPGSMAYYKRTTQEDRLKYPTHNTRYLAHNASWAFQGGAKHYKYNKMDDAAEVLGHESRGGSIVYRGGTHAGQFDLGGLRFGVEICADHDAGRLAADLEHLVDVHVIMSASVGLRPQHLCARDGGYVLHANASTPPAAYQVSRDWISQEVENSVNPATGLDGRVAPFHTIQTSTYERFNSFTNKFRSQLTKQLTRDYKTEKSQQRRTRKRDRERGFEPGNTLDEWKLQYRNYQTGRINGIMDQIDGAISLYELDL